jgi:recombination protein RecA
MLRRYYVAPCDEADGRRTYDVMERAVRQGRLRRDEATAVANYRRRFNAERDCRERNLRADDPRPAPRPATPPSALTITSGIPALDEALGGGYAHGRVVELFGLRGAGKRALSLLAIAACQRAGGTACFMDCPHTLDVERARDLGVEPAKLLITQPDSADQLWDILECLARTGAVDLVVVDDATSLPAQEELTDADVLEPKLRRARLMSRALRTLTATASRTGTTVVFLSQLEPIAPDAAHPFNTEQHGHTLKYYASQRLDVRELEAVLGTRMRVKVTKNKIAPPFKSVDLFVGPDAGIWARESPAEAP